jgi:hypothetical protein
MAGNSIDTGVPAINDVHTVADVNCCYCCSGVPAVAVATIPDFPSFSGVSVVACVPADAGILATVCALLKNAEAEN